MSQTLSPAANPMSYYTSPRPSDQPQAIRINVYPSQQRTPNTLQVPMTANLTPPPTQYYPPPSPPPTPPTAHYITINPQQIPNITQPSITEQYQAAYNPQITTVPLPIKRLSTATPQRRRVPAGKRNRSWSPYPRPLNPEPPAAQFYVENELQAAGTQQVRGVKLVKKRVKKKTNRVSPQRVSGGQLPRSAPHRVLNPQPLPYAESAMVLNPDPLPRTQRFMGVHPPEIHKSPQQIDIHVTEPDGMYAVNSISV